MGGKTKVSNPIRIRPDASIGANAAETDDMFLFSCFIDHPSYAVISDHDSPKTFLLGRTGNGKTAILKMVEKQKENVSDIDLQGMAMDYVANSDIIRFLESLNVDLDILFQSLWKHVLCLEFIRLRFSVQDEERSSRIFTALTDIFKRDDRKKSAINYLSEWEKKFWITMDENIKEIIQKFESKVDAELGAEVNKFKSKAGYARSLSGEKKAQIVARANKIIDPSQLADLSNVLNMLADYDKGKSNGLFYILIDQIDERWVDEAIRFRLIRALIECLKPFRKIRNLKIIVSMRTDVIERVVLEGMDTGFQREKYDDYFMRIVWNKDQLYELVQKRINYLYRRQYTSENVFFNDVFQEKVSGKRPFDYMIERTLYRPRDIISFVNLSLQKAQNDTAVRPKNIKSAESEYSRTRLEALETEWKSAIPSISIILRNLSGSNERFLLSDIADNNFLEEIALHYADQFENQIDPFSEVIKSYLNDQSLGIAERFAKKIACELYRIGAIGLKLSPDEPYVYAHRDTPFLNEESISMDDKVHIHPMLHQALNINSKRK